MVVSFEQEMLMLGSDKNTQQKMSSRNWRDVSEGVFIKFSECTSRSQRPRL